MNQDLSLNITMWGRRFTENKLNASILSVSVMSEQVTTVVWWCGAQKARLAVLNWWRYVVMSPLIDTKMMFNCQICALFLQQKNGKVLFQKDNAPSHRAGITQPFVRRHNVNVMSPWPALSSALNVIEQVGAKFDLKLRKYTHPDYFIQLKQNLINAWNNIP